jgi:hypothetical protein
MSGHQHSNVPICKRNTLLSAEHLQQHRDSLMPGHAGVDRQMSPERTGQDPYAVATLEHTSGGSIAPLRSRSRISLITSSGTFAGCIPSITRADNAGAPTGGVSLQPDQHKGIAGKQRWKHLGLVAPDDA